MANTLDSNTTSLAYAEETSLKTLPGSPVWYGLEPNSYSDFGGNITTIARSPITIGRQKRKGAITDFESTAGFNQDFTQGNLTRLLQGFFFADIREKMDTKPYNGTAITITGVTAADDTYAAASGLDGFVTNQIVWASGFTNSGNNGLKVVVSAAAAALVVGDGLVNETPTSAARLEAVGIQGAAGDITLTASSSSIVLGSTLLDFTTLDLSVGEWIFIGGDTTATKFANTAPGYARIASISAHAISISESTFAAVTDTGATKTIQIFFGKFLRNENTCALIKRRSYQLERQLGCAVGGVQSEYITGAIPNQFVLNVPRTDKLNMDLSFIGMDVEHYTALEGIKTGIRVASPNEDAFNTSSEIYRIKMSIVSPTSLNPTALFAYVSDFTLTVNNNVSSQKALGVLGSFDASTGDFEVTGSLTAYFSDVEAVEAVRANSDISLNAIFADSNKGVVFDMPLCSLSDARLNVTKDQPITVPLNSAAYENSVGYTLSMTFFTYLPNIAMPA